MDTINNPQKCEQNEDAADPGCEWQASLSCERSQTVKRKIIDAWTIPVTALNCSLRIRLAPK